jgi:purine-nucleoside phosphorylase
MTSDTEQALRILRNRGVEVPIEVGIVLGTGLGSITDGMAEVIEVPYADLPGFPQNTVSGHDGHLVTGLLEGLPVAVMRGRAHYYEHGHAGAMEPALRTLAALGCRSLLLTNSAGSLHPDWYPGSLALITDHINLSGTNPLVGALGDDRFVSLAEAYDGRLRARLKRAAAAASVPALREGVYMWFSGPSFETPAEIRMAKLLGADLVGMSTVPEVIIARRLEMRVAAISMITNFGTGIAGGNPSHGETKDVALSGAISLKRLLRAFMRMRETTPA